MQDTERRGTDVRPSIHRRRVGPVGERLFYPGNRIVKVAPQPKLPANLLRRRANAVRARIEATVVRRAPQVMVKVTGGGRGMKAIAAHFKYISKNGRLDIEDDRDEVLRGKGDLRGLVDDWRLGGTPVDDVGFRREAFNIMLSMPRGVDPLYVLKAVREFANVELADHKYVMVLHDHQANPHVHLSVRAESRHGKRLNPRKADLSRWRQTFAEKLRGWGIEAEASSRGVRGQGRGESLWRIKAREDQRLILGQHGPAGRHRAQRRVMAGPAGLGCRCRLLLPLPRCRRTASWGRRLSNLLRSTEMRLRCRQMFLIPEGWNDSGATAASQRFLSVRCQRRTHGLWPLAVMQASPARRPERRLSRYC